MKDKWEALTNNSAVKKNNNTSYDKKLKSQKHNLKIGTLNTRTIKEDYKREKLFHLIEKSSIAILGIQEHRILHTEQDIRVESSTNGRSKMYSSSAVRNKPNAPCGGVKLILNQKVQELMINIEKFNDRILIANFAGNPKTTVVVVYSPVEGDSDENREQFYDNLTIATKAIPKHNFLIVMGDFNAHIGKEDGFKYTYH